MFFYFNTSNYTDYFMGFSTVIKQMKYLIVCYGQNKLNIYILGFLSLRAPL